MSTTPRSIVVARFDHLGDHVLGTGLLRALRTHYPDSRLLMAVSPRLAGLYARCTLLDGILTLPDAADFPDGPPSLATLADRLAPYGKFEMVIHPRYAEDNYAAGVFCRILAAPGARVIGFRQHGSLLPGYDPNRFYTDLIEAPESLHTAEYASLIAGEIIGGAITATPELWFSPEDWAGPADRWSLAPGRFVVVGIGASVAYKLPPLETYAALGEHLISSPYRLVLVGTEREAPFADAVRAAAGAHGGDRIISLAGKLHLPELAAVLGRTRLYIGPDAGPKHMAAAVGAPVVEICWVPADHPGSSRGPSSAGRCWRPWNTQFRLVHPDGGSFAHARRQPSYQRQPIAGISPPAVTAAVDQLLAETSRLERRAQLRDASS